ncbi:hypothetical protein TI05_04970, partial [Achromatium sp. WMS3]
MHTDNPIYRYLSIGTVAFHILTNGIRLFGKYKFQSLTFKDIERRIDAAFIPQGHDGPTYLIEFQAQWSETAWYNLLAKMGLYGEQNPKQQVHGLLIFLNHTKEATHSRWISQNALPHWLQVIYLDDFLLDLLAKEHDNPFIAVFAPLILKQTELEQQAPKLWHTIHTAEIPDTIRSNLQQILELWFFEKFKDKD